MPGLLLIAGNGRNVGKTFLACKIIRYFSQTRDVTGVKISPHFHPATESDILIKTENFIIVNEKQINEKDSSLMLQSGAKPVVFMMVKPGFIGEAFEKLQSFLPETLIVCESGQVHEVVTPGLFLFVKRAGDEIIKPEYLKYLPVIVNNNGNYFDFDIQHIQFENNELSLKPELWENLKK